MKTYKEHQIIMLSTNNQASALYWSGHKLYITSPEDPSRGELQHLYIISDEEIKEDDWFISENNNKKYIDSCKSRTSTYIMGTKDWSEPEHTCKKIIASTDKSLSWIEHDDTVPYPKGEQYFLPQIPQQFIEQYIESYNKGNIIDKVLIEYEDNGEEDWIGDDYNGEPFWNSKYELKLNPDNTINIKLKHKETYSREEVEELKNIAISLNVEFDNMWNNYSTIRKSLSDTTIKRIERKQQELKQWIDQY